MTDDQNCRTDALDHLTDALSEDILKAPGEELLAEVEEDCGDRRALVMEFDRIFARVQQDSGRLDAVSRIRRIIFAIRKSGISLLARKKEAPSTQNERFSLLGARDWQGARRQATVHSSRTTQEWFASRIREVDSPASGRGQAVYLSEEFQPLARYRTLQDHTQTPQADELYQRIQGYQVEFQRQRHRRLLWAPLWLVFLAFVATAGIFGYHSLTTPVMKDTPSSPVLTPSSPVLKAGDQKIFASGRGDEKTRFDFGPAGFYQWEPAPTKTVPHVDAPMRPVISAEQAPTRIVPRDEQPVDFESFPRALYWAPGPTIWSLTPTTGIPAATSGNYVVQLASQRSEADAQASFKALQQKYPSVLGSYQAVFRRTDLGDRGVYYRAQVGPFATAEEANDMCSSLKSAGDQCVVQRN
jgi:cell division septation protein DedD